MTDVGKPIPAAKIRALREALERGETVRFRNGSVVRHARCVRCESSGIEPGFEITEGRCLRCGGEPDRIYVLRPAGGIAMYARDEAGYRSAYAMAHRGPQPRPGITGRFLRPEDVDTSRFGEAPW